MQYDGDVALGDESHGYLSNESGFLEVQFTFQYLTHRETMKIVAYPYHNGQSRKQHFLEDGGCCNSDALASSNTSAIRHSVESLVVYQDIQNLANTAGSLPQRKAPPTTYTTRPANEALSVGSGLPPVRFTFSIARMYQAWEINQVLLILLSCLLRRA